MGARVYAAWRAWCGLRIYVSGPYPYPNLILSISEHYPTRIRSISETHIRPASAPNTTRIRSVPDSHPTRI